MKPSRELIAVAVVAAVAVTAADVAAVVVVVVVTAAVAVAVTTIVTNANRVGSNQPRIYTDGHGQNPLIVFQLVRVTS